MRRLGAGVLGLVVLSSGLLAAPAHRGYAAGVDDPILLPAIVDGRPTSEVPVFGAEAHEMVSIAAVARVLSLRVSRTNEALTVEDGAVTRKVGLGSGDVTDNSGAVIDHLESPIVASSNSEPYVALRDVPRLFSAVASVENGELVIVALTKQRGTSPSAEKGTQGGGDAPGPALSEAQPTADAEATKPSPSPTIEPSSSAAESGAEPSPSPTIEPSSSAADSGAECEPPLGLPCEGRGLSVSDQAQAASSTTAASRTQVGASGATPAPAALDRVATVANVGASTKTPLRLIVDLTWNGESAGRALVLLADGDVLMRSSDLDHRNLRLDASRAVVDGDDTFLPLRELKRQATYRFSSDNLTLDVTTDVSLLPHRKVAFTSGAVPFSNDFVRSVLLNYSISGIAGQPLSGAVEQRINLAPNATFENEIGRNIDGSFSRGITALTLDAPSRLRRVVIGDTTLSGDELAGSANVLGFAVSRTFALDPYVITFPLPTLDTTITAPTEALVYVNGALVKSIDLQPGRYNLNDIPVLAGYGHTQVVLRNQFGAQVAYDSMGAAPTGLLRKGLSDYQYGVGLARAPYTSFWAYGSPAVSARYRVGVSDGFTVGGVVQSLGGSTNADVNCDAAPRFGLVHASAAFSSSTGLRGRAGLIEFANSGQNTNVGVIVRAQSANYRTIGQFGQSDPSTLDVELSLTQRVGRLSAITISDRVSHYLVEGSVHHTTATTSRPLGGWLLSMSAFTDSARTYHTRGIELTLGRPIGRRTYESFAQAAGSSAGQSVAVTHSGLSPLDTSYQLTAQGTSQMAASAQVGLPYGTADVSVTSARAGNSRSITASGDFVGSVLFADGAREFSQQVRDGYALVETAGMANVPIFANNLYAGRTDSHGLLVVPFLSSNQNNEVDASSDGLPLAEIVDSTHRNVGPSYHAGTRVRFTAHRIHAISGHLSVRFKGSSTIPAFGVASFVGRSHSYESGIDETGRFYVDGIEPGTFLVNVKDSDGAECMTSVNILPFDEAVRDVGGLVCVRS